MSWSRIWPRQRHGAQQFDRLPMSIAAADIAANLINPRLKTLRCIEAIHVIPCFEQCLLHDIVYNAGSNASRLRNANQPPTGSRELPICIAQKRIFEML